MKDIKEDLQKLNELSDGHFNKFIKNKHNINYRDYLIDLFMIYTTSLFDNILEEMKKC